MPRRTQGLDGRNHYRGHSNTGVQASTEHVYRGRRDTTAPVSEQFTVTVDDEELPKRYDLLSASPSGFSWAYSGSGPVQLAIAMLAHAYDEQLAFEHYQQFKREVIARLPEDRWMLTTHDLDNWLEANIE